MPLDEKDPIKGPTLLISPITTTFINPVLMKSPEFLRLIFLKMGRFIDHIIEIQYDAKLISFVNKLYSLS